MRTLILAGLLAAGLGGSAEAATVAPFDAAAFRAAQRAGAPILIDVTAPWCPTCAAQKPILNGLYDTKQFHDLRVFTVDFDTSKPLLRRLGVQMQSTLIAYHGATEQARATGIVDPAAIHSLLDKTLS